MGNQLVLDRVVSGTEQEIDSLDSLYRRFGPIIYRRCQSLLGNEADGRDALQEVFLQLCNAIGDFRGDSEILTWIYRIATNVCISRLRRRQVERRVLEGLAQASVSDPRPRLETSELVRRLIERLPADQVQLLIHVHHDGLSQEQIARILGVSTRMVRKRLSKAERIAKEIVSELENWRRDHE